MKKMFFMLFCFFWFYGLVFADPFYATDIYNNRVDTSKIYTRDDFIDIWIASGSDNLIASYYDKNGDLLESFGIDRWTLGRYIDIGIGCNSLYNKYSPEDIDICDINQYGIYYGDQDISEIRYWKIVEYENWEGDGNIRIYDFCRNNEETMNSKTCSDIFLKSVFPFNNQDYWSYVGFMEYEPASFELICEPKKVKKGETSDCKLKVKATEEITEIIVPIESELFEIIKFDELDSWELIDNEDGTVTITPEMGFKGSATIMSGTFKFKEDLLDNVDVQLNNISYTTVDGIELEGSAGDSVNIYEEVVEEDTKIEEDKKEEIKNPDTVDMLDIVLLCILLTVLVLVMSFRMKNELR